jgi:hypothetical protein
LHYISQLESYISVNDVPTPDIDFRTELPDMLLVQSVLPLV